MASAILSIEEGTPINGSVVSGVSSGTIKAGDFVSKNDNLYELNGDELVSTVSLSSSGTEYIDFIPLDEQNFIGTGKTYNDLYRLEEGQFKFIKTFNSQSTSRENTEKAARINNQTWCFENNGRMFFENLKGEANNYNFINGGPSSIGKSNVARVSDSWGLLGALPNSTQIYVCPASIETFAKSYMIDTLLSGDQQYISSTHKSGEAIGMLYASCKNGTNDIIYYLISLLEGNIVEKKEISRQTGVTKPTFICDGTNHLKGFSVILNKRSKTEGDFLYSNLTGESPIPYSEVKQVLPIDGASGVLFMYGNGMQQIYDYPNKKLITQTGTAPEGTKYFSVGNDIYGYKVNGTEIKFYKVKISNYNAIGPYNGTDVYGIAKTDANLKEQVEAYIPR